MPVFVKGDRGLLFAHIPKTGGSSIEKHLQRGGWKMYHHDGRVGKGTSNYFNWCTPQHMHGEMLEQSFRLARFSARFAVVRNPIARFQSEYAWRLGRGVDVSSDAVEKWGYGVLDRFNSNPFILGNHIRPQVEFLVGDMEVYRFEDGLDGAMSRLNTKFSLNVGSSVGRERTSDDSSGVSSSAVEVSQRLEDRLREFYKADFQAFGY
ncbi:Sulfotransferase family protein [Paraoerskovia marina]|uniref:Sulfotransferase family protein n=1 Tax=Paraoerskovia marina TaxID=545619 RepID=A0A1H1Q7F1_9CELL|nr:Sulfotransferase family protein [Paraoerskovia marina]